MAVAAEALSPEAESAVSSAAAGRGSRLTPEVRDELRRRATAKSKPAKTVVRSAPARSSGGGGGGGVVRRAKAINNAGAKVISGGKGGMFPKIIFAFGAGLVALELASYVSGRYFTWNLKAGAQKLHTAARTVELYPGQAAKLAPILKPAPPAVTAAVPQYAGTRAV